MNPYRNPPGRKNQLKSGVKLKTINNPDNTQFEYLVAGDKARDKWVIFFHGDGQNASDCVDSLRPYEASGFSILIPEYRGYGGTSGQATMDTISVDLKNILETERIDGTKIKIVHGYSLGTGPACKTAIHYHVPFLIIHSGFRRLGNWLYATYDNEKMTSRFFGQILFVHGTHDDIFPMEWVVPWWKNHDKSFKMIINAGHSNLNASTVIGILNTIAQDGKAPVSSVQ